MERHRDIRRGNMAAAAAANGLSRRRPRSSASTSNSLRDSPEDDGAVELQETTRLRDRASKKDRERLNRNKRRRGDRLMLGGHREDGGEDSTEDSIDDDEEDEDDESSHLRMRPPNHVSSSSAQSNHHLHRKSFPPAAKVVRATTWRVSDEMGFSVPKKARSACTKRSHESWVSGGGGVGGGSGEQVHQQASTSPARPNAVPTPAPAPTSPSSSTASIRKKMKPIGAKPKHKPPKPSAVQDDIEIEVAEVLYGLMRQSQCPSRQESATNSPKLDSRDANGSGNDSKSRVSSPISAPPLLSKLPQNSSSTTTPISAVAPKRKRPRPVKFEEENTAIFANKNDSMSSSKNDDEKTEASSTKLDKNSGSNGIRTGISLDFGSSQATNVPLDAQQELKPESNLITELNPVAEESIVRADDQTNNIVTDQTNNIVTSPKKESSCSKVDFDTESATAAKASPTSVVESHREENFKIDLMAPPSKSSPERDGEIGSVSDSKPVPSDTERKMVPDELREKENVDINCKKDVEAVVLLEKKTEEAPVDECVSQKPIVPKHTMLDPQIDSEKDNNKDCGPSNVRQQQLHIQQQQHQSKTTRNEPKLEIAAQSISSVPLPMNITGWPGGLTPMGNGMGQIRFQGITSLDGTPGSSNAIQPPHPLHTQPRAKRCATHYYIARNIYYHQQLTKNSFWSAAAGAASLYGNKPYNLNVMPPTEAAIIGNPLLGSFAGKNMSSMQDRGQVEGAKDKSSVAMNFIDSSQGKIVQKQMVLQQPPHQAAIQGPAFIFPPTQQQAVVSSGAKNGAAKATNIGNAAPSPAVQLAAGCPLNSSSSAAGPTAMSFSYPNMGSEAQYVAILQNNGYTFPVPAHVGAPSSYRGTAAPAVPFYSGPVYSSQVMHPSQLQQQQLQQQQMQQSHSQQPSQQGHQNTSTSSGSSSSQKHQQQNHQQRLQGSGSNATNGTSNGFPASKNRPQKQQNQPVPVAHQVRHHESDMAVEDGTSTEANRMSQAHKNTYSHNFAVPMNAKNFASLSSAALASGGNGNHSERQHQQQHQSSKGGTESIPNQTFAMPFTSFNGGTTISGLDFSSMAQNHVIFQSLPETARHGYQIASTGVQTTQQKKNHQVLEEGKTVSDSNNVEDERKTTAGKGQPSGAQAIVFSRTDSADPSVSTILGNSVVESSARTLNLISSPGNGSRSSRANTSTTAAPATTTVNAAYSQQQHLQQKQMSQLMQVQHLQQIQLMRQQQMHQQMAAAAAARGKPSTTSSTSVYTESLSASSSMAAKFSNTHYFPEALIQGGSSTQSPQWKNTRTAASSSSSPSLASATSSLKNFPQQQGRAQQGHTQISFGVNSKQGNAQHGQQISTGNQSPSSPVVVGSPPTSISKSAGGSPRASSTGNKLVTAPSLSSQQQAKTSSSGPSRKSSPVGGRNAPSNLGNSHINPAPCSTTKSTQSHQQALHQHQHQQQQQQQQQQKQALQQAQLFFSNAYMQAQSPQSNSTTGNATGAANGVYYQQRRQPPEQQHQLVGSSNTSSGMLSLCPLTLASTTSDPTKAVAAAAAAGNMKGGLPPPGLIQAGQFATQSGGHPYMSTAFPYIHSVPSAQVKPSEQKQPAGNDNLHACCQPEKR